MRVLYHGFDTLQIAFMGAASQRLLEKFAVAREEAEKRDSYVLCELSKGERVQVAPSGAKGGYRYRILTGEQDLEICIKHSHAIDKHNLHVKVRSLALATKGYKTCIDEIYTWLEALEVRSEYGLPLSALSRVDYCVDLILPNQHYFDPEHFVYHSRCKAKVCQETSVIQGKRHTGLTIGRMPNAQIIVYDKTLEVMEKRKDHWWSIWGLTEKELRGERIWRVEIRAGKKMLQSKACQTLEDFMANIGIVLLSVHRQKRYVRPNANDSNLSRAPAHPIWQKVQEVIERNLGEHVGSVDYHSTMPDMRHKKRDALKQQIPGTLAAYGVLYGSGRDTIIDTLRMFTHDMLNELEASPSKLDEYFQRAHDKHYFLT